MNHKIKKILLIFLIFSLFACSNKQAQTKKYFRIDGIVTEEKINKNQIKLVVKKQTALSILVERPKVATQDDLSLVQLNNHFCLE